jgi:hypothetical protein
MLHDDDNILLGFGKSENEIFNIMGQQKTNKRFSIHERIIETRLVKGAAVISFTFAR